MYSVPFFLLCSGEDIGGDLMEININAWLSYTINCLALILLVGFATYLTRNPLCLLGLIFLHTLQHSLIPPENSKVEDTEEGDEAP